MTLRHRLELLLGLSLFLSFFSWGRRVLYPFQIFTTWIHECCHAITAALLGGEAISITLSSDGSGLTRYKITKGTLKHAIIASAGYLGASLSGCFIFFLAVSAEHSSRLNIRSLVIFLCTAIVLSLAFWIRNAFGFFSLLVLAAALGALNFPPAHQYAHEVLLFLAVQAGLNALFDIRILFGLGSRGGTSDAHTLQKLFYLPHYFWALAWLGLSISMMIWTIQQTI